MGALSIVTIDPDLLNLKDTVLRQSAKAVAVDDPEQLTLCQKLALEMFEAMYSADGAALAAPQVSVSLRLIVMDPAGLDFGPHVLINPVIDFKSEVEEGANEGCLSLPRRQGRAYRSTEVHLRAYNLKGECEEYHATGWLARIFQHEVDHLDGILYPDRLRPGDRLIETDVAARRRAKGAIRKLLG